MLYTPICDYFGIEYPIVLAGMGGVAMHRLAAAVSNAGGLGVIGAAGCSPAELREEIRRTRELTDRPFAVGTTIRIVIELAKTCQTIQVEGQVKWTRQNEAEGIYEIGVEFLHHISQTILTLIRHLYSAGSEIPSSVTPVDSPPD